MYPYGFQFFNDMIAWVITSEANKPRKEQKGSVQSHWEKSGKIKVKESTSPETTRRSNLRFKEKIKLRRNVYKIFQVPFAKVTWHVKV